MIEHTTFQGKPATIAYLTAGMQPATKDDHTMVKVIFDDGDILFATRVMEPAPTTNVAKLRQRIRLLKEQIGDLVKYNPNEPRDYHGRWTTGGGDGMAGMRKVDAFKAHANTQIKTVYDVLKVAQQNHDELLKVGAEIAHDVPDATFQQPRVKTIDQKGIDRVVEKAAHRGFGGVTDVARMGFVVDTPEDADKIVAGLRKRFGDSMVREGFQRNSWGYYDDKVLVKFDSGLIGEVQIKERHVDHAKYEEGGEKLYAERVFEHGGKLVGARSLPFTDQRRIDNKAKSRALYAEAVVRSNHTWQQIYDHARYRAGD